MSERRTLEQLLGMSTNRAKHYSSDCQAIAAIPEDELANKIAEIRTKPGGELTASAILDHARSLRRQGRRSEAAGHGIEDGNVLTGDFKIVLADMPDESIDLIFTDPPYAREYVHLYEDLGREAARLLRPGGSLIAYVGGHLVLEAGNMLANHLRYWWELGVFYNTGSDAAVRGIGVFVKHKALLWFVKEYRDSKNTVPDAVQNTEPTKELHDWQQGIQDALVYIEALTEPGHVVLDPMCGAATTLVAAQRLGRRYLGVEIDEERADVARYVLAKERGEVA